MKHIRPYPLTKVSLTETTKPMFINWDKKDKHYVKTQLMRYMRLFGKQVRSDHDDTIRMNKNNQSILFNERNTMVRILFDFADTSTQFLVDYFIDSNYLITELRDKPYLVRVEFQLDLLDSMKFVEDLIKIQKSEELKIYIIGSKFGI